MCIRKDQWSNAAAIKRSISDIDTDATLEDPVPACLSSCASGSVGFPDLPVPEEGTTLADSLDRGLLAREFCDLQPVGSGGYGKVVKAWHRTTKQWVALKLIPLQLRASETVDDNNTRWSGLEVFQHLQKLRSSKVIRYGRRWSELSQDLPSSWSASLMSPSSARAAALRPIADPVTPVSTMSLTSGFESSCGFEWVVNEEEEFQEKSAQSPVAKPDSDSKPRRQRSGGSEKHYDVVLIIQMEYCDGITLADWLAYPKLRPKLLKGGMGAAAQLFRQLMQGLADLHEAGIVHWDVKPANILISKETGTLKIFDFGLAKLRSDGLCQKGMSNSSFSNQVSRTAIGTPGYAPPEHCMHASPDKKPQSPSGSFVLPPAHPQSDIFSAGIILVELLMAGVAGEGPSWTTAMERISILGALRDGRESALPATLLRDRGVGAWLRQLVFRMVNWSVDGRPTAQEVLDEIEAAQWASSRHNPYLGTQHSRSPQFAAMLTHISAAHNPYIGFFLDHRRAVKA
ncbi:gcn2 [Symbiodinium sp. CCMP2592]|nr:gcn2 [Symbiodinium sp. CCMP2592]